MCDHEVAQALEHICSPQRVTDSTADPPNPSMQMIRGEREQGPHQKQADEGGGQELPTDKGHRDSTTLAIGRSYRRGSPQQGCCVRLRDRTKAAGRTWEGGRD